MLGGFENSPGNQKMLFMLGKNNCTCTRGARMRSLCASNVVPGGFAP